MLSDSHLLRTAVTHLGEVELMTGQGQGWDSQREVPKVSLKNKPGFLQRSFPLVSWIRQPWSPQEALVVLLPWPCLCCCDFFEQLHVRVSESPEYTPDRDEVSAGGRIGEERRGFLEPSPKAKRLFT